MSQTVVIVAGPTASGKSTFALEEVSKRSGVIINGDSLQLYQGLPLLTAQPTPTDCEKAPHFLYRIFPPHAPQASAAAWQSLAIDAIEKSLQQGKNPWIVGGTGFYLKVLLAGLSPMPTIREEVKDLFKKKTEGQSTSCLFDRLKREDPLIAGRLSPQDRQRILRALLVSEATEHPLSFWQKQPRQKVPYHFKTLYLNPPRRVLHQQIEQRFDHMRRQGVIEEVETFLKGEKTSTSPLTTAIGFRQISDFLNGQLTESEAFEKIIFATRQYAKRQETWFRHQFKSDWTLSTPQDKAAWQSNAELR